MRKTKVEGWRIRVSVERRAGSDASPGAGCLEVMIVGRRAARTVNVEDSNTKHCEDRKERESANQAWTQCGIRFVPCS